MGQLTGVHAALVAASTMLGANSLHNSNTPEEVLNPLLLAQIEPPQIINKEKYFNQAAIAPGAGFTGKIKIVSADLAAIPIKVHLSEEVAGANRTVCLMATKDERYVNANILKLSYSDDKGWKTEENKSCDIPVWFLDAALCESALIDLAKLHENGLELIVSVKCRELGEAAKLLGIDTDSVVLEINKNIRIKTNEGKAKNVALDLALTIGAPLSNEDSVALNKIAKSLKGAYEQLKHIETLTKREDPRLARAEIKLFTEALEKSNRTELTPELRSRVDFECANLKTESEKQINK